VTAYSKDLEQFLEYVNENYTEISSPDMIDKDVVRNWIILLMDNRKATTSVRRKISALKTLFKYLTRNGVIQTNPLRYLEAPKGKQTIPYFVREAAMNEILDKEGDEEDEFEEIRNRLVLEMLYSTGVRQAELLGICNSDIDYITSTVRVTGKRNKQRLIPFGDRLRELMLAYTKIRNYEVGTESNSFFVRKNGTPLSSYMLYTIVRKKLSVIPSLSKRSPHVLRHSFATSMLNDGAELNAVKELLGHSSLSSTEVYTHTTFEELKKMYHAHPRAKKEGGLYGH
jgi:integrase/recombinase XerC